MRVIIFFFFMQCISVLSNAQSFADDTYNFQKHYKEEFLKDAKSPLKEDELRYLKFFKPDSTFRISANFERIVDTIGFQMQTHSKVLKHYYLYGTAKFILRATQCKLFIYQSKNLMTKDGFEDYLFVPFMDKTNYSTTYGGGRYLDLKISEIKGNQLVIDFNKAYNPYCAYKEGYSCPIPPVENRLNVHIKAGEQIYKMKK